VSLVRKKEQKFWIGQEEQRQSSLVAGIPSKQC